MIRCEVVLNPSSSVSVCCLCLKGDADCTVTLKVPRDVGTFHLRCCPELTYCRLSRFVVSSATKQFLGEQQQAFQRLLQRGPPGLKHLPSPSQHIDRTRHLLEAFKFLTYTELSTLALVSRLWRQVSEHDELWKQPKAQLHSVPAQFQHNSKLAFIYKFTRTCFSCGHQLTDVQVEMICPRTGRCICIGCFYSPEQGLQTLQRAASVLDVSKNTLKAAQVLPLFRLKESLVLICTSRSRLARFRESRRVTVLEALDSVQASKWLVTEVVKLPLMSPAACSIVAQPFLDFILAKSRKTLAAQFLESCLSEVSSNKYY